MARTDIRGHLTAQTPRRLLSVFLLSLLLLAACTPRVAVRPRVPTFAQLIAQLSEEGGYFPSDNLVSNELGYQKVLQKLDELNVRGGVYIGVGPEQNFTYIAAVRPTYAFILDIRRDNRLQHLYYKALFALARNRAEYLALWLGRPLRESAERWTQASIADLVRLMDAASPDPNYLQATLERAYTTIERFGVPLTPEDRGRIEYIARSFYEDGLDIRYETHFRRSWRQFPTLRQLLLETDLTGRPRNFLASEESFQFLKQLHAQDRIIPVTGDFAGPKALRAIGDYVRSVGETVSVFYVSNVEYYLLQNDTFAAFAENVKTLPRTERSLLIRSYVGYGFPHPEALPGYFITTLLQRMNDFIRLYEAGEYRTYWDVGMLDYIPVR
ncbi:MAG: hypothetical protein RML85_00995 [Acidobacteriota bacterium]|nr:hypothetical protein [Acidobacteriota bacterium]